MSHTVTHKWVILSPTHVASQTFSIRKYHTPLQLTSHSYHTTQTEYPSQYHPTDVK